MIVTTKDGSSVYGIKVVCTNDKGEDEETGFLNVYNSETVGWNYKMEHAELKVPKIALGLVVSRTDDNNEIRKRRGLQDFSIMAQNSKGEDTVGISANDRITKYNTMMTVDNFPRVFLHRQATGGVGWPLILAIVITVVGASLFGATIYYFKTKYGLTWSFFMKKEKDTRDEVVSVIDLDAGSPSTS